MVSVLPRTAVPMPMVAMAAVPKEGDAMFAFVRGTQDDAFSFYGPNFACQAMPFAGVEFQVGSPRQ